MLDAYLDAVAARAWRRRPDGTAASCHTADARRRPGAPGAVRRAGFAAGPWCRAGRPDGAFPTVAFPNPEEPGALDLALAVARSRRRRRARQRPRRRPARASPSRRRRWRVLTGDEIGVLLADHVLHATGRRPARRVLPGVVVDARPDGGRGTASTSAATLTGFKWIVAAAQRPGARFVFGYEEALGYAVGDPCATRTASAAALGVALLLSKLEAVRRDGGPAGWRRHLRPPLRACTRRRESGGIRMDGLNGTARAPGAVERLRGLAPGDRGRCAGHRMRPPGPGRDRAHARRGRPVVVRPSGTEPKLKCYLQVVLPASRAQRPAPPPLPTSGRGLAATLGLDPGV